MRQRCSEHSPHADEIDMIRDTGLRSECVLSGFCLIALYSLAAGGPSCMDCSLNMPSVDCCLYLEATRHSSNKETLGLSFATKLFPPNTIISTLKPEASSTVDTSSPHTQSQSRHVRHVPNRQLVDFV